MAIKKHASACPMDCPDTCGLEVEVRDGEILGIKGSNLNPTTQGFICTKVARFARRVYAEERLLYPMRRWGAKGSGQFKRISWEEAARLICEAFQAICERWGGEAILPYSYGGSNGMLGQDTSDRSFFARLGASRLARTVCAAPTSEAALGLYGKMPGVAFEDYAHARRIVIWGANPKVSNIHLMPYLKEARARGARIAVVDPRRNFSEAEIDLHLPVYPGADGAVALAMIRYYHEHGLFNWAFIRKHCRGVEKLIESAEPYTLEKAAEIARVPPDAIQRLADFYLEADPAVLRVGWGLERNRNGAHAVAAVLALPAVLGKFGKRGAGYTLSNSNAYKVDARALADAPGWRTRIINMNKLGRVLLEEQNPPIEGLFVYNCNPVATVPNQNAILRGLQREDLFTVVFDQVRTDTAQFADVLLPAVTFLEQREIKKAYGSYGLHYLDPVIPPRGEAKPNEEVFALLGRAMGWDDAAFREGTEAYLHRAAGAIGGMGAPVDLAQLRKERIRFFDFPGRTPVQFKTVFPWTHDGKINLAPGNLGPEPYAFLPEDGRERYPLALISPATDKTINSTMGEYNLPELFLSMSPEDAEARGIGNGSRARVFNALGEVVAKVRISRRTRVGVVVLPKGAWRKASVNGATATALVPDAVSPVGGGACFNDARVEVEAL